MAYTLTSSWRDIQERNIDPFSDVTSDNHNKLLKILGNHKAYIKGFDYTFERDSSENRMIVKFDRGICVINYMVIEFIDPATIVLFQCPTVSAEWAVVVEYQYSKISPVPFATIKVIDVEDINDDIHLVLFTFWTGEWDIVPLMADWLAWFANHHVDYRRSVDNIPDWASGTFVRKSGDTMVGSLILKGSPITALEAATKGYIDSAIANHGSNHLGQFLPLIGGTMTGFITLHDVPTATMHASNKGYVDTQITNLRNTMLNGYVNKSGDTMTGMLMLFADPTLALHAATKQYVDGKLKNHDAEHDDRFVNVTGDSMTGDLTVSTKITTPNITTPVINATIPAGDLNSRMSFKINDTEIAEMRAHTGFSCFVGLGTPKLNHSTTYSGAPNYMLFTIDNAEQMRLNTSEFKVLTKVTTPAVNAATKLSFQIADVEKAYVNSYGLVGSVYNADIVELFDHNFKEKPRHGTCVVIDKLTGKIIESDKIGDESVLGFVSYTPAITMGGDNDWDVEFNVKGRIPVAILGQIDNVVINSIKEYPAGISLVSGLNGSLIPFDDFIATLTTYMPGRVIAKALKPIHKGTGTYKIVITRS